MTILKHPVFEQFSFKYPESQFLFEDFSLPIPQDRWLAILGPSGVGKSTLLHAIAKQFQSKASGLKIALLPQSSTLLPWLTILDNVQIGDLLRGTKNTAGRIKATQLLAEMGLADKSQQTPAQLSGGQCQRAIIARTIYEESDIVLMDEPFASLDAITKQEIQDCAQKYFAGKTVILVTHDPLEALRLCDQIVVLKGKPVHYEEILSLYSATPRKLDDPEIAKHYNGLMDKLLLAKQQVVEEI